jgi:Flp pilus assembly protein TadG
MMEAMNQTTATRMRACLSIFARADGGVAGVEFGLIAGLFILLIGFWMELGYSLLLQSALDSAVRKEARLIRIGQMTAASANAFKTNLCNDVQAVMSCSGIQVNVASASSFAGLSAAVPSDAQSRMTTTGFNPGTGGQAVIVQVGYTRNLVFPIVNAIMGKNGTLLINAATVFQNEPF